MVRLLADGGDHHRHPGADAVGQYHQRPHRAPHARPDRGRDHARVPDRVHADGHGRVLRLVFLLHRQPRPGHPAHARSLRTAHLRRDVERRADRHSALPLHGLPGGAGAADRSPVPQPASRDHARARLARRGNHHHLRHFCHGHGHRGGGRDVDGPAGVSRDAQGGLQHQGVRRGGDRGRLSRHPDTALGAADRLRRDGGGLGRAALRGRLLPRFHARGPVHRLRHRPGEAEAGADAAAAGERAARAAAARGAGALASRREPAALCSRGRSLATPPA